MRTVFLLLLLLAPLLQANPLRMQQQVANNQRLFSYQFRADEQDIGLQFALEPISIQRNGNLVRVYVPDVMQQQLWRELQQKARQAGPYQIIPEAGPVTGQDPQNFQVKYFYPSGSLRAQSANTERLQLQQQLRQFSRQFQQQYLSDAGYQQLTMPDNRQLITVDHRKIIEQSLADISPAAQTIVSQLNPTNQRQLAALLLNWVQLIPGHPAEQAQYGHSFTPPLQLLRQHQGDSASKTVLLATLLRSTLPTMKQAILYLPERTMLALAIPAEPGELTVTLQETDYLLADPSGLQPLSLGEVAKIQEVFILNRFFDYRLL
ncbi:hypothetical protein SAMN06297280_0021 [Arsukibacterium tuosuense]|uniref:Uncharacterized protein n=1 Tax=Arsukibacterium tuosuense TaxID=1323745 RepID=A0A285JM23_9GAMM|nr:hypothetical protein [Arsukibacterium tuosuense]SNY60151.1 hypothetical protein SAMN06297280_0021 [Arsukibacterium tuosuense]